MFGGVWVPALDPAQPFCAKAGQTALKRLGIPVGDTLRRRLKEQRVLAPCFDDSVLEQFFPGLVDVAVQVVKDGPVLAEWRGSGACLTYAEHELEPNRRRDGGGPSLKSLQNLREGAHALFAEVVRLARELGDLAPPELAQWTYKPQIEVPEISGPGYEVTAPPLRHVRHLFAENTALVRRILGGNPRDYAEERELVRTVSLARLRRLRSDGGSPGRGAVPRARRAGELHDAASHRQLPGRPSGAAA
jgi:hypothetical protein